MAEVEIYAFLVRKLDVLGHVGPRSVSWRGQVDWPGAPRPGDTWFHCGDWGGEEFERVGFQGPEAGRTHLSLEARVTPEVLAHLLAEHGFEE